jgi:hypothetical protein
VEPLGGTPISESEAVEKTVETAEGSPPAEPPEANEPGVEPVSEPTDEQGSAPAATQPQPVDNAPAQPAGVTDRRPLGVAYDGRVYRKRDDNDVLSGHFCDVVDGPYAGRYGVLESTGTLGIDGYPDEVVVLTRDADAENILVSYADIRPSASGRR